MLKLLVPLLWAVSLLLPTSKLLAYEADPFDEYNMVEFASMGLGTMLFAGDFAAPFKAGGSANIKLGLRVVGPLLLVPTVGGAIVGREGTSEKVYSSYSLRARFRLTPKRFPLKPYLEAGFGLITIIGTDFQWLAGLGLDILVWGSGSLGIETFFQHVPVEDGLIVPIHLAFTRFF